VDCKSRAGNQGSTIAVTAPALPGSGGSDFVPNERTNERHEESGRRK